MTVIALLGRRDSPTDALEDYCSLLGQALEKHGQEFKLARVSWFDTGWTQALWKLWKDSAAWKGQWVLVQYTALSWSRRGFPLMFLLVLGVVKIRHARTAVVFHDQQPRNPNRFVDMLRLFCKRQVMRWAYRLTDASILTIPLERIPWLPRQATKAAFIPIGSNLPVTAAHGRSARNGHEGKTITVFAVTDCGDITKEVADITLAARRAAEHVPHVRLVTVGRGSAESEAKFREALRGSAVEFRALGVLTAENVSKALADSDVSLYVRSPITTQRGSAIASISNGIPLVAYAESALPPPLAEAGVVAVHYLDGNQLADATVQVLTDPQLWRDLHQRSLRAYEKYFSWEAVASNFLEVMKHA